MFGSATLSMCWLHFASFTNRVGTNCISEENIILIRRRWAWLLWAHSHLERSSLYLEDILTTALEFLAHNNTLWNGWFKGNRVAARNCLATFVTWLALHWHLHLQFKLCRVKCHRRNHIKMCYDAIETRFRSNEDSGSVSLIIRMRLHVMGIWEQCYDLDLNSPF